MRWMLLLAACSSSPPYTMTTVDQRPIGAQLLVAKNGHVDVISADGKPVSHVADGPGRVVGPTGDGDAITVDASGQIRRIGKQPRTLAVLKAQRCGAPTIRATWRGDDGHGCIGVGKEGIDVVWDVELATGEAHAFELPGSRCAPDASAQPATPCALPAPMTKGFELNGQTYALIAVSPRKRWEIYQPTAPSEPQALVFVDVEKKQRYAPARNDAWPAALVPGVVPSNASWPDRPQISWIRDELAAIDGEVLVEVGVRTQDLGSFVRF